MRNLVVVRLRIDVSFGVDIRVVRLIRIVFMLIGSNMVI